MTRLDEYPLRCEEIVTHVVCAAILANDYYRSPTFTTLCGKTATWPGHAEVPQDHAVTCLRCWEKVLPKET